MLYELYHANISSVATLLVYFQSTAQFAPSSWSPEILRQLDTLICTVASTPSTSQSQSLTSAARIGRRMLTSVSSGVSAKLSNWASSTKATASSVFKDGVVGWATRTRFALSRLRRTLALLAIDNPRWASSFRLLPGLESSPYAHPTPRLGSEEQSVRVRACRA